MTKSKKPGGGPTKRRGGNPPKEHQFKPGESGNPGGRPKKKLSLRDVAWKILDEKVGQREDGEAILAAYILMRATLQRLKRNENGSIHFFRWLEGPQPPTEADESGGMEDGRSDEEIIEMADDMHRLGVMNAATYEKIK